MPRIDAFLQLGREQRCSDIHFTVGQPPLVRLDGELTPLRYRELTADEIHLLLSEVLTHQQQQELDEHGSVDLSYATEALGRFRINACRQLHGLSTVCRVIPQEVPRLAELGLPAVLAHFSTLASGIVLITGGAGTGKSTTLAALVNEINDRDNVTVITLEDPIEFVHKSRQALIVQRELGAHIPSFHEGVRRALRQDPDVILVGEMRDQETITAAIEASETGHLVFGTLHTRGAYQTLHRILDAFPVEAQEQLRHTVAEHLKAVVCQQLVRLADGRGRRAVAEVLVMTPAIAQLIRDAKTHQVPSVMATGRRQGMQLLDQELLYLVQAGEIDPDEAFLRANDKKEFIMYVQRPELLQLIDGSALPAPAPKRVA
jgi:twitching motility protein PilT